MVGTNLKRSSVVVASVFLAAAGLAANNKFRSDIGGLENLLEKFNEENISQLEDLEVYVKTINRLSTADLGSDKASTIAKANSLKSQVIIQKAMAEAIAKTAEALSDQANCLAAISASESADIKVEDQMIDCLEFVSSHQIATEQVRKMKLRFQETKSSFEIAQKKLNALGKILKSAE